MSKVSYVCWQLSFAVLRLRLVKEVPLQPIQIAH